MQDIAIEKLGLSVRTSNCLRRSKVFFLSQIMLLTEADLKQIRNMGEKSIEEVLDLQNKMRTKMGDDIEYIEAIAEDIDIVPGDVLLIHKSFPQIIGKQIIEVLFKVDNEMGEVDIPISELGLSVRTTNALLANGYDSIKKVAFEKAEVISSVKNMGARSINELILFIRDRAEITLEGEPSNEIVEKIFNQFRDYFNSQEVQFDISVVSKSIKTNLQKNKEKYSEEKPFDELINNESFIDDILRQNNVENSIENYILSIIQKKRKLIELSTLNDSFPPFFIKHGFLDRTIDKLIEEGKIEKVDGKIRIKLPNVSEWIETLKDNQKVAVSFRLNHTLEECGVELGVTRERVRQIVAKALKTKPILREDDNAYWYTEYLIDKEAMCIIFEEREETYDYLKMAYDHGTKNVEDMVDDPHLTKELYINLQRYINRNSILIDGEYVPCKRDLLCKKLAQSLCSESDMSFDEFYDRYMDLLRENEIDSNEKLLFPSERAFEARLDDSKYILMKYGRKFRYYPIQEYDIQELVQELHFEQFNDVEISTLKLFVEYSEVMQEYGIADEYELHNLLKKTQDEWNENNKYNVVLTRMPFMAFGNADRQRQTEHLLFQVAPVTIEEYCQFYEMEYGVLARTAMANMTPFISNYYHEGLYTINQPLLDEEENQYLADILNQDFYFIDDIKEAYLKKYVNGDAERVNPRTLKELGFRVFTNYVVRNSFSSADEYFTSVYMKNDLLDLNQQDSRIVYVQSANQALDNLRSSYELLEYEDKKYIKYSHLISVAQDMTKDKILRYVDDAIDAAGSEEFFTIKKLKKEGFDDALHNIGLGDWFNAGLLKNSKRIRFTKVGGGVIFYKGDSQFTTVDFIRYVLKTKRKMDIDDFVDYVFNEYGIRIPREKITWLIKNSDMYYDTIMEKIYLTKEEYYDEI